MEIIKDNDKILNINKKSSKNLFNLKKNNIKIDAVNFQDYNMDSDLDYSIADEYLDFEENESDDNEYYPYEFAEGLNDEEYIDTEENLDEELNLKKNYIDLYYYRRDRKSVV